MNVGGKSRGLERAAEGGGINMLEFICNYHGGYQGKPQGFLNGRVEVVTGVLFPDNR